MDHVELLSAVTKKLDPFDGGHDYYWSLRKAIDAYIAGETEDVVEDILDKPTREIERRYNKVAFSNFTKRFGKAKKIEIVNDSLKFEMPQHEISISVDPWFATEEKGVTYLHVVWAMQQPELEKRNANIGCHILEETFSGSKFGNSTFCVMDLANSKRFSHKSVTDKTVMALDGVAAAIHRSARQL